MPSNLKEWSEGIDILADVEPDAGPEVMYPRHEEIQIFVDPADVSEEDTERLDELGFYADPNAHPPRFNVFV